MDGEPSEFAAPSSKLVLVVDDDPEIRSLLEMLLKGQGFQVALAADGGEALALCDKREPDLVVTDLKMPRQGGYEFLRGLQAAGCGRVPVIVVTGSVLAGSTLQMIKQEGNVVETYAKPIRAGTFTAAVHKHLGTAPASAGPAESGGLNDRAKTGGF